MLFSRWQAVSESLLVIELRVQETWRLALGLPLLTAGAYLVYLCLSAPFTFYAASGWAGVASAVPGMLVTAVLAACTAPLGWWIVMLRRRVEVDTAEQQVREVLDWRLRKHVECHPMREFGGVRVAREFLAGSAGARRSSRSTGNVVRLMARAPEATASAEVALFESEETLQPLELGQLIATMLHLPIEIALDEAAPVPAPGRARGEGNH